MKRRILCLLLGLLCAWLLSRYLSKPVNELDEAMKRVEKGDYAAELSSDREDEMGRALALARRAWELGADALIVQDVGLARRIRAAAPG